LTSNEDETTQESSPAEQASGLSPTIQGPQRSTAGRFRPHDRVTPDPLKNNGNGCFCHRHRVLADDPVLILLELLLKSVRFAERLGEDMCDHGAVLSPPF